MLTIRQAQFDVFSKQEVDKFEKWMLAHLKKFFPAQCSSAGDACLRDLIQYGMKRAADHKFSARRDVCKYIDLMLVFGRDFDTDRRLPWAAETLRKSRDPEGKMCLLFGIAMNHLREA
jgi:hypothetical protein